MRNPSADHRSKINYDLNKVLEGGLEDSIQSLILLDQQEQASWLMGQHQGRQACEAAQRACQGCPSPADEFMGLSGERAVPQPCCVRLSVPLLHLQLKELMETA